jgi:hypothetical protein
VSASAWICVTCGVQHLPSASPPQACAICLDERQYVGWEGQRWTTMDELVAAGHTNRFTDEEPGLVSIGTEPEIAIGQRALLVRTPAGNVLWDCITFLNEATIEWLGATNAPADDWDELLGGKGASLERLSRPITA